MTGYIKSGATET